jgi:catechol 2,3-dioxygenase-like lactoylglutathione lyase family enzyme
MFSHIVVGSNDIQKSKTFYDAIFATLGMGPATVLDDRRIAYRKEGSPSYMVTKPLDGKAATHANGGTIGFNAETTEQIDAWHAAGCANGGTSCENPPGVRDLGFAKMYLAYLRDPDNNKLCAMKIVG